MRRAFTASLLLAGCASPPWASLTPGQEELCARELAAAFALVDRFDTLDTAALPFVRVTMTFSGSDSTHHRFGFLLGEDASAFTVRYLDLAQETHLRNPPPSQRWRVRCERADMAARARALARQLRDHADYYLEPDAPMAPTAEALLLARACARRGMRDEVRMLWWALESCDSAVDQFAYGLDHLLRMDFADPAVTREQLLDRHRRWLDAFPKGESVQERARILERMIAEDRAGPRGDLVARLIFALRDAHHPAEEWDYIDGFMLATAPRPADGPAQRLVALALDAAPALIEAVTDESLTRCVWYGSRLGGIFWIIPVGRLADHILQIISGLRFWGTPDELQAEWRGWWKDASKKGEEAVLAEYAARGDRVSVDAAKRLLDRWPGRIADVLEGARRAEEDWIRAALVAVASRSPDDRVAAFLLEEVDRGRVRVEAASALLDRGRREGVRRLAKRWIDEGDDGEAWAEAAAFVLRAGDVEAVALVAKELPALPPSARAQVVTGLRNRSLADLLERAAPADRADIERHIEGMLQHLRDDTGEHSDAASCLLRDLWPARYAKK